MYNDAMLCEMLPAIVHTPRSYYERQPQTNPTGNKVVPATYASAVCLLRFVTGSFRNREPGRELSLHLAAQAPTPFGVRLSPPPVARELCYHLW